METNLTRIFRYEFRIFEFFRYEFRIFEFKLQTLIICVC